MFTVPQFKVDTEPARPEPIQYLTENGFRIIRRCDVDESIPKGGIKHYFIVRDPDGYELDITVYFETRAAAEVIQRSSRRVTYESSYWVNAAERHLAEYLWENNDYPANATLNVDRLTPDDVDLAQRWSLDES